MSKPLRKLDVELVDIDKLVPYAGNARTHDKKQIGQIADSIKAFGWMNPIVANRQGTIVAGHGRLEAAKLLGLKTVPVIRVEDLTEDQERAYRLADNQIATNAGWDLDLLKVEMELLSDGDLDFEITDTGFAMAEIDLVLGAGTNTDENDPDAGDVQDLDLAGAPITRRGDVWVMDNHRLICGDALSEADYATVMQNETAAACVTDPPHNQKIFNNVSGSGRHGEFAMASGEMSRDEFVDFLKKAFGLMAANLGKGALAYVFMDWRHLAEALCAGEASFAELINMCVWVKTNGGMGSLYRSAHEDILVFKASKGRHTNNVQLGRFGRSRTNVWRHAGVNSFGKGRDETLQLHPTVKPTALIADAILDCTNRKELVLDPFAGSGTILIAAHRTGRHARAIEYDPKYVDVSLRRFRRVTGIDPVHAGSGKSLSELEAQAAADRDQAEG